MKLKEMERYAFELEANSLYGEVSVNVTLRKGEKNSNYRHFKQCRILLPNNEIYYSGF